MDVARGAEREERADRTHRRVDKDVRVGVGMTQFAKHIDRTLPSLAEEALDAALRDAGASRSDIGQIFTELGLTALPAPLRRGTTCQ